MKVLDEVIIALDVCTQSKDCKLCPYSIYDEDGFNLYDDCPSMKNDALQWLKGYKAHIEIDKLRDKYVAENEPLTWDELKHMEGKPVWVEILSDEIDLSSRWMMVARETKAHSLPLAYTDDIGHWIYGHEDKLGKTWQAYRKEQFNTEYEDIPMEYFENGGI